MAGNKTGKDNEPILAAINQQDNLDDVNNTTLKKLQYGTDVVKPRFTRKKWIIVGCVLMTELCERLTFYSVVANLILFCTSTLDISSTDAARINFIFSGIPIYLFFDYNKPLRVMVGIYFGTLCISPFGLYMDDASNILIIRLCQQYGRNTVVPHDYCNLLCRLPNMFHEKQMFELNIGLHVLIYSYY